MYRIVLLCGLLVLSTVSLTEGGVVATVNGVQITEQDLQGAVDALIPRSTYHGSVSPEKRKDYYEKALQDLIEAELKYQDAISAGMKPDRKAVKSGLERIKKRFKRESEYQEALAQYGMSEKDLRSALEKSDLIQARTKVKVTDPSRMSDKELRTYYEQNRDKYRVPESVSLRMISTKDENRAREALERVRAGENFGDVAARMSEDRYRIMGGKVGDIHRGRIFPQLEQVAFSLKPGSFSDLIKAEEIWFILKVEEKKPEHQIPFDEALPKMRRELEKVRSSELEANWVNDLRSKARIERFLKPVQ